MKVFFQALIGDRFCQMIFQINLYLLCQKCHPVFMYSNILYKP